MKRSVLIAGALCLTAGCGKAPGLETVEATGTVTWNGAPLPAGDILFEPAQSPGNPSAGKIINGEFKLRTTPGKKKVQIHATRDTGIMDPVMKSPKREAYIPEEFNANTRLTAEVTPGVSTRISCFDTGA